MSTDYSAVCHRCRQRIHIGQLMAGRWSFGYGTDDQQAMRNQGKWLMAHEDHEVVFQPSDRDADDYKTMEVAGE